MEKVGAVSWLRSSSRWPVFGLPVLCWSVEPLQHIDQEEAQFQLLHFLGFLLKLHILKKGLLQTWYGFAMISVFFVFRGAIATFAYGTCNRVLITLFSVLLHLRVEEATISCHCECIRRLGFFKFLRWILILSGLLLKAPHLSYII
ncbi:hypothetical protein L1987_53770 [Smallanthus sonchifolius]|uniref:Uncharacterized protein n=1 Tax=Smallanthus sonchifolius TaxID=185202 RepID=A0ACB9EY05_9ASTR|nr:hypothetical protein L1987_53770 [Smallanthus sonchifolius]